MYKSQSSFLRPSTTISWYKDYCETQGNTSVADYIQENFIDTHLMVHNRRESSDGLILFIDNTLTLDGLIKWHADGFIQNYLKELSQYNKTVGITLLGSNIIPTDQ
jgi:hypothetical protein